MDAATPNPKKPRLSRRLLSHLTLTLTILVTLAFICLAVISPPTQDAQALTWEEAGIVAVNAAVFAGAGSAFGPVGTVLGAGAGAVVGMLVVFGVSGSGDVYNGAAAIMASNLKNQTMDLLGMAKSGNHNTQMLWNTSAHGFARNAAWAAKALYDEQTANSESYVYDSHYVLSRSGVGDGSIAYVWSVAVQYSAVLNLHLDLAQRFVGDYADMHWGYYEHAGSSSVMADSSIGAHATRGTEFMTALSPSDDPTKLVTVCANNSIYILNCGTSDIPVLVKNAAGEAVINEIMTPSNGVIDFMLDDYGLASGEYSIDASYEAAHYTEIFGMFGKAISNARSVYPAMISFYKDGENAMVDFACYKKGAQYMVQTQDPYFRQAEYAPYIYFCPSAAQYVGCPGAVEIDLASIFTDLGAIIGRTSQMQVSANNFAQSYYNAIRLNGGGDYLPMPDILFPDVQDLLDRGYTWEQIYLIYMAYLDNMDEWFENHSVMRDNDVNISAASLDLVCLGGIYAANGTMLYGPDCVFTPVISLDDMTLTVGENNTMTQPGFAIVWMDHAETLEGLSRVNYSKMDYVPLHAGYNLSIMEMTHIGEQVDEYTLTITTLNFTIYAPNGNITGPQSLTDMEWIAQHWYYIAVLAGVVCLLGAMATRNTPILAAGLVLIAAGAIGWFLAGDHSLLSWLSMEPSNLRAWLQNLR